MCVCVVYSYIHTSILCCIGMLLIIIYQSFTKIFDQSILYVTGIWIW